MCPVLRDWGAVALMVAHKNVKLLRIFTMSKSSDQFDDPDCVCSFGMKLTWDINDPKLPQVKWPFWLSNTVLFSNSKLGYTGKPFSLIANDTYAEFQNANN